ncbi:SDR family NAD(P)-dependent oxidoreductase [Paracoccus aerius]|uniref:SDR family NAD(P)-dependent oxidoreductase n=1 Tax=Paracoccus aerius TaxID=1915382 RepID=A0ABS1S1M1_9RHOB|nr:SDR family NAD(P)-dependent oxidoreductase [Paracoccus aerius]MBL3672603.1 SDR family NAD(P)-dependent oxidoreductase [Paracoccus aerius]GHG09147.1 3-hydroxyacyl-CoA dehydrogenase [Paracoccus aerius]
MDLGNSRAIVTGGASGLGAATVDWFRSQGAQVVVLDRAASDDAHHLQADVTSADSTAAAIAQAVGIMGGIDVCVNCAGVVIGERTVGRNGPHDLDAFRRVIEVNLVGSFNVLRLAAAEMARNGRPENGVIVNTASIAAFDGQKGQAAYAASKAGIAGMTLPLARDLAGQNIRVCAIAPGIFATPMLRGLPQDVQDSLAAEVTFPARLGDPQEFARMAAHIVENAYLNGEVIRLDGALRMR